MKKAIGLLVSIISLFCVSSALAANYTWPCSTAYGVSNSYGHNGHIGTDFGTPIGSEVYAIAAGTVVSPTKDIGCTGSHNGSNYAPECTTPGCTGSYANYIVIDHGNNVDSLYAHLKTGSFRVSVGQTVAQGQVIALSGNAGNTYGAHLHLELMIGDIAPITQPTVKIPWII